MHRSHSSLVVRSLPKDDLELLRAVVDGAATTRVGRDILVAIICMSIDAVVASHSCTVVVTSAKFATVLLHTNA